MKNEALKFLKKICKNRVKVTKKMVIFFLMTGGLLSSQVNFSEEVDETKTATIKDLKDYTSEEVGKVKKEIEGLKEETIENLKNYDYPNSLHFVSVHYSKEDVKEYKDYYKYLDLLKEKIKCLKEIALEEANGNDKKKKKEIRDKKTKLETQMKKLKEGNKLISQKVTNEIEGSFKKSKNSDKDKKIEEINNEYTERIDKINKLSSNFNNLGIDFAHSIAIGKGAEISGENGIAIGVDTLSGKDSISLGKASIASGEGNIAIGRDATLFSKTFKGKIGQQIARILNDPNTIVKFENDGDVEYKKTIVIGDGTKSSGNSNIAIGDNAVAMKKRLTLISSDNGGTLSNKNGAEIDARNWNDIAKQFYNPGNQDKRSYKFEAKPVENAIALGKNASAFADNVIAIGKGAISGFESAVSIGENADTEGKNSVAIGKNSIIFGESSVAIGEGSRTGKIKYVLKTIEGKDTVEKTEEFDTLEAAKQELEKKKDLSKIYRIEVEGGKSGYSVANSVAIGKNSAVEYDDSVAIGADSLAVKSDGKSAFTDVDHASGETVSFGNSNKKRRLTNIADGKDSSDAVTVAQLKKAIADNKGGSGGSAVADGKYANISLSNIDETAKNTIKDKAKESIEIVEDKKESSKNDSGIVVTKSEDKNSHKDTYKIKLDESKVKEIAGTTNLATEYAKVDADNITVNKWAEKLGTGSITTNETNLVTGKTVFNAIKNSKTKVEKEGDIITLTTTPSTDDGISSVTYKLGIDDTKLKAKINESKVSVEQGEGIKVTSTANKYTVALADELKTKIDGALQSSVADGKYANISLSNIDETAKNTIKDKAKESIEIVEDKKESSKNDSGIVVTKSEDKNSHKDTYKIKLDESKVKEIAGTTNLATEYAKVDADNITVNKWAEKLGTGKVANGDAGLVTGSTIYNYMTTFKQQLSSESTKDLAKKLNADADNLSETGKTTLTNKLGTGEVAENNTNLVTGGKVYTKLNEIKTDLDNKYKGLNTQVTTNTGDITALKTTVEGLKNTTQEINNIKTKLDDKLDKNDLSITGDNYITADKDDKFNYTLKVNKTKLESDLDLTNNNSINSIFNTKLGNINTNIGELKTSLETNTNNINSLTTKADTNTSSIIKLQQDMGNKLNADATNLSETGKTNLIDKLSKDSNIAKPKDRLVTDRQVNTYLSRYNDALGVVDKKSTVALEKSELALGGVANAVAMANLVQVNSYSRHRHNLSAAYGYYGGAHALAVGFSGTNEERNFVYKLSGSVNNKGNLAFGVGAGVMLGDKDERLTTEYSTKLKTVEKDLVEANKKIKEYEERQKATDIKVKELERKLNQILNKH